MVLVHQINILLVDDQARNVAISRGSPELPILSRPVRSSQPFDTLAHLFGIDTSHAAPDGGLMSSPGVLEPPPGSGEKILVVDDAPMNRLVAQHALEQLGYRAVVADSGPTALRMLVETDFAVVLMDCRMPEMDGFEATRSIRRREAAAGLRRVPIVALAANAQEGDRDSCLTAGMDDYLSKPLDMNDLARVLRRWTTHIQNQPVVTHVVPIEIPPVAEPSSRYALDPGALAEIREVQVPGEPDLVVEMIEAFLTDARAQLVQLTTALAQGDAKELANAAHSLKSGAGYLGARELQRLCIELENLGRSGRTEGGQVLAEELQTTFEHAKGALTEELTRHVDAAA